MTSSTYPQATIDQAQKLIDQGWDTNLVLGSVTRKRDQRIKLRLYERSGVREYWMVDPDTRGVTIHRRAEDGSFPVCARLSTDANDTLRTPLLPEWSLDLARLFRPLTRR